jgi:glyoxylase-like metal-dependent hydrolase (beta-lactamase superfamily II)
MPLPFALDHINLWLLEDSEGWTQIDCGYGDETTRGLWQRHFESTMQSRPVRRLIATHYHPDHVGNAAWLSARWGCSVVMPQAEYLTAHAVRDDRAGYVARRRRLCFAPTDCNRNTSPRSTRAATPTSAVSPSCRSPIFVWRTGAKSVSEEGSGE